MPNVRQPWLDDPQDEADAQPWLTDPVFEEIDDLPPTLGEYIGAQPGAEPTPIQAMESGKVQEYLNQLDNQLYKLPAGSPERAALAKRTSGLRSNLAQYKSDKTAYRKPGFLTTAGNVARTFMGPNTGPTGPPDTAHEMARQAVGEKFAPPKIETEPDFRFATIPDERFAMARDVIATRPVGDPERKQYEEWLAKAVPRNREAVRLQSAADRRNLSVVQQIASEDPIQQRRKDESVIAREIGSGATAVGQTMTNAAGRLLSYVPGLEGLSEKADQRNRVMAWQQQLDQTYTNESELAKTVGKDAAQIISSVANSYAQTALVAPVPPALGFQGPTAGVRSMAVLFGAQSIDKGLTTAKDKKLDRPAQLAYATGIGALEAGLMLAFGKGGQRLGAETAEEVFFPAVRNVVEQAAEKSGMRAAMQRFATGAGLEFGEEATTALSQQLWGGLFNVNSTEDAVQNALKAGVAGVAGRAVPGALRQLRSSYGKAAARVKEGASAVAAAEEFLGVRTPSTLAADTPSSETPAKPPLRPGEVLAAAAAETARPGKAGRGSRNAKQFFEQATPDMIEAARQPLSQKEFASVTGRKKTSQIFRDSFRDTLNLYAQIDRRHAATDSAIAESAADPSSPVEASPPPVVPVDASLVASEAATAQVNVDSIVHHAAVKAKDAKRWLKENFLSAGLRNEVIDRANDSRLGDIADHAKQTGFLNADLNRAVKAAYGGKGKLTPDQVQQLDDALKGGQHHLPAPVQAAINAMRAHVDALSRKVVSSGLATDALEVTITENEGTYLTRTYRKHSDKTWVERARQDEQLIQDARDWLKNIYPSDTAEVTDWRINAMLDKDGAAANAPNGMQADADFLSVLKDRRNIPDVIRKLYGEYSDPWINYTTSVAKLSNLVAHKEFTDTVRSVGLATGFLSDAAAPTPRNYRRIDAVKTPLLKELGDLYTTPETAQALSHLFAPEFHSSLYRNAVRMVGYTKWAQTVGNSKTHVRNFLGGIVFSMSNGDLFMGSKAGWVDAVGTTWNNLRAKGVQGRRDYIQELARLRVIDSNADVGDIQSMVSELTDQTQLPIDATNVAKAWNKVKVAPRGLSSLYQSGDAIWKIMAFENKKKQYARAYPDETFAQIKQRAADDVVAHYPSYAKVPRIIRLMSRFPLLGDFVSFHSEVFRTLKNNLVTITRDSRSPNPVLRDMAHSRAVGLASSLMLVPAMSMISKAVWDILPGEEEDLRKFQAPWSENSQILYLGKDEEGGYDTLDLSFMDARAIIAKPIFGAMREGDALERIGRVEYELLAPLKEGMLAGKLLSWWRNTTPEGRQVYNEQASLASQSWDVGAHFATVISPGTLQQLNKIRRGALGHVGKSGQAFDPVIETAALIGARSSSVDVKQSLSFRNYDLKQSVQHTEQGIRQKLTTRGTVTPGEIDRAYRSFNAQRKKLWEEWHETSLAAVRLGVPVAEVVAGLEQTAGKAKAEAILANQYQPYLPGESVAETILIRPNGQDRIDQLRNLHQESIEEESNAD